MIDDIEYVLITQSAGCLCVSVLNPFAYCSVLMEDIPVHSRSKLVKACRSFHFRTIPMEVSDFFFVGSPS